MLFVYFIISSTPSKASQEAVFLLLCSDSLYGPILYMEQYKTHGTCGHGNTGNKGMLIVPSQAKICKYFFQCIIGLSGSLMHGRRRFQLSHVPEFRFMVRILSANEAIHLPGSVNWYHTLLKSIKHSLVHRMATAIYGIGQIALK